MILMDEPSAEQELLAKCIKSGPPFSRNPKQKINDPSPRVGGQMRGKEGRDQELNGMGFLYFVSSFEPHPGTQGLFLTLLLGFTYSSA